MIFCRIFDLDCLLRAAVYCQAIKRDHNHYTNNAVFTLPEINLLNCLEVTVCEFVNFVREFVNFVITFSYITDRSNEIL